MGMTNWRSVTDLLEDMNKHGVPADRAIEWVLAAIHIGKAAQVAADQERRARECRECEAEAKAVHRDWVAILGSDK
jgi:hypothetical protein